MNELLKISLLVAFLSCACEGIFAQIQPNTLTSDSISTEHVGILFDERNTLTFNEVLQKVNDFDWSGMEHIYEEYGQSAQIFHPTIAFWWHLQVSNETSDIDEWAMHFYKQHRHEVYIIQDQDTLHISAGEFANKSERNYLGFRGAFRFELQPCEQITFFIKHTKSDGFNSFLPIIQSLERSNYESMLIRQNPRVIYHLIFVCIAFFLSIFTFLQLLLHRDRAYLYYALYLFSVGLYFLQRYEGQKEAHIIFTHIYEWYYAFEPMLTYALIFFYVLFAQSFFEYSSPIEKAMRKAVWLSISVLLFSVLFHLVNVVFFNPYTVHEVYLFMRKVCILAILPIPFLLFKNGTWLSYLFLVGTMLLAVGAIVTFWAPINAPMNNLLGIRDRTGFMQISMLFEFLCFSTALGYKTKLTQDENTRIERELSVTELKALKAQLNPHFIFNCLTSIKNLVIKNDNEAADKYLQHFAKLIRSILVFSEKQSITLTEELQVTDLYLKMETLRFSHSFKYEINIESGIDTENIHLPPLIFQPYLENAIHHGLLQKEGEKRLIIDICKEKEKIICAIDDNGIGRRKAASAGASHTRYAFFRNAPYARTHRKIQRIYG